MVLYLDCMCQCGLNSVLWLHIGILMLRLAAEPYSTAGLLLLLLLLLLKKVSSARLGESDIHPISLKTPAPQCQPIDRKKRKGKRVVDYSRDRAGPMLFYWPMLLYPYYSFLLFFPFSPFCLLVGIVCLGSSN